MRQQLVYVPVTGHRHLGRHYTQVIADQVDNRSMLGRFLRIVQYPPAGIRQRSIDRSLHRIGIDMFIPYLHEYLRRENNKTIFQPELIPGFRTDKNIL